MTWICENCGKEFRNSNQWHSCFIVSMEEHLKNKSPEIQKMFMKLMDSISVFGEMEIIPKKSSIQYRVGATFLGVKLKREEILIEFFLSRDIEHELISRKMRISGKRMIYYLSITSEQQIDNELSSLLKEAYLLVKSQKR